MAGSSTPSYQDTVMPRQGLGSSSLTPNATRASSPMLPKEGWARSPEYGDQLRIVLRQQHDFKRHPRPGTFVLPLVVTQSLSASGSNTQTWPLVATWAQMSSWPQGAAQVTQISMFPGSNTSVRHPRDLRWQPRPLTSAWLWVVRPQTST